MNVTDGKGVGMQVGPQPSLYAQYRNIPRFQWKMVTDSILLIY